MTYHISVGMLNPIHLLAGQKLDCKTEIISREQYVLRIKFSRYMSMELYDRANAFDFRAARVIEINHRF